MGVKRVGKDEFRYGEQGIDVVKLREEGEDVHKVLVDCGSFREQENQKKKDMKKKKMRKMRDIVCTRKSPISLQGNHQPCTLVGRPRKEPKQAHKQVAGWKRRAV